MKEGTDHGDGAHLIAIVQLFQTLGPNYEMPFWPIGVFHIRKTPHWGGASSRLAGVSEPLSLALHSIPIDVLHFGRANNEEVAFRVP